MKDTKTDQAILKGGLDAPVVSGDFHLFEVSIHSPSNLGEPLFLNHESIFQELNIYEDLFSNVLKGTFIFRDTQGWAEMIPLMAMKLLLYHMQLQAVKVHKLILNLKIQIPRLQVKKLPDKDLRYMIV